MAIKTNAQLYTALGNKANLLGNKLSEAISTGPGPGQSRPGRRAVAFTPKNPADFYLLFTDKSPHVG
jgi:hypothetical protein